MWTHRRILQRMGLTREWKTDKKTGLSAHYLEKQGANIHLYLIHAARIKLVVNYLPPARVILDLGGAGSPLYELGYPHAFDKMTIVDLSPEQRDPQYKEMQVSPDVPAGGEIVVRFGSMIRLDEFIDQSVDLVWAGQSIEHVSRDDGKTMCQNVFRVLKKGGSFCLDTPNRYITKIHTQPVGGGFINPDHKFEYYTDDLQSLLQESGFKIVQRLGLCHMPNSTEKFSYQDFLLGDQISTDMKNSYIQYYHCKK